MNAEYSGLPNDRKALQKNKQHTAEMKPDQGIDRPKLDVTQKLSVATKLAESNQSSCPNISTDLANTVQQDKQDTPRRFPKTVCTNTYTEFNGLPNDSKALKKNKHHAAQMKSDQGIDQPKLDVTQRLSIAAKLAEPNQFSCPHISGDLANAGQDTPQTMPQKETSGLELEECICCLFVLICYAVVIGLAVHFITVGVKNLKNCPIEPMIPMYLIVSWIAIVLYFISLCMLTCCPDLNSPAVVCRLTRGELVHLLIKLALFCWEIAGAVLVYRYYTQVQHGPEAPLNNFNKNGASLVVSSTSGRVFATNNTNVPDYTLSVSSSTTTTTHGNQLYCYRYLYNVTWGTIDFSLCYLFFSILWSVIIIPCNKNKSKDVEDDKILLTKTDSHSKVVTKFETVTKTGEPIKMTSETNTQTSQLSFAV